MMNGGLLLMMIDWAHSYSCLGVIPSPAQHDAFLFID